MVRVIGIDPGKNGAIAIMDGGSVTDCHKMPDTVKELFDLMEEYCSTNDYDVVVYLEKVGGMPGNGGASMFNFGRGYGWLEATITALQTSYVTVTPQKWEKYFQLASSSGSKSEKYKNNKLRNKEKAQQLFPKIKILGWNADALLIAKYGYEQEK